MSAGSILSEAWQLYKAHWRHLLPIAFVIYLVLSLVTLLLTALFGVVGALLGALVSIVGLFWLQAALVEAVADVRDGRADLSMGETIGRVKDRILPVGGAGILAGLAIGIGLILLIVPGLVLMTWWAVIVPVIVLERVGALDAFGRSRQLVRGHGWTVFGLIVLTILLLIGASIVLGIVFAFLPDELASFLGNIVSNTLFAPFIALALTILYYRLREPQVAAATPEPPAPAEPTLP
jgi:hypothetical protein